MPGHVTKTRIVLAALVLAGLASPAAADHPWPSAATLRAWSGVWTGQNLQQQLQQQPQQAIGSALRAPVNDRRFPPELANLLRPKYRAAWEKFKSVAETEPPTPDNNCLPFAMPGESVTTNFGQVFHITPRVIGILIEIDAQMRLVHMDVDHPKDLKPSMHGHSVGHWEGDTLVIDTIGFDPRSQFNDGITHSDKLHVVERYRLVGDGREMEKTFVFTDPEAFTGPYTIVRRVHKDDEPFQEYLNAQNNREYPCPTAEAGSAYKPVE